MDKKVSAEMAGWIEKHAQGKLQFYLDCVDKQRTYAGATMAYISALMTLSIGAVLKVSSFDGKLEPSETAILWASISSVVFLSLLAWYLGKNAMFTNAVHSPGIDPEYLIEEVKVLEPDNPNLPDSQMALKDIYQCMIAINKEVSDDSAAATKLVWQFLWWAPAFFLGAFLIALRIASC